MLKPIPQYSITHYGKGNLPKTWLPGDVAVVRNRRQDFIDNLIRCRSRRTCGHVAIADLDHMFCVADALGGIIEAEANGIIADRASKYVDDDFWVISFRGVSMAQRLLTVAFWRAQIGTSYDYLDIVATQAPIALFAADFSLHGGRGWICSGLGCTGLLKQVVEFSRPAEAMAPADFCLDLGIKLDVEPLPLTFGDRVLDALCWPGRAIHDVFAALGKLVRRR